MPSFTVQVADLQMIGPMVDVQIAVGRTVEQMLRAAGAPEPLPVGALAMLDTGASMSVVRADLVSQLGLRPVGVRYVSTPSSVNVPCDEYLVRLILPNQVVIETPVLEAPLAGHPIQCLIGRDVLAQAVLVYIGPSNLISLSF